MENMPYIVVSTSTRKLGETDGPWAEEMVYWLDIWKEIYYAERTREGRMVHRLYMSRRGDILSGYGQEIL